MHSQPTEIILHIFQFVPKITQIQSCTLVCNRWYAIIKSKKLSKTFEEFLLTDDLFSYLLYAAEMTSPYNYFPTLNVVVSVEIIICELCKMLNGEIFIVLPKLFYDIDQHIILEWLVHNNYLNIIKHLHTHRIIDIAPYIYSLLEISIAKNYIEIFEYLFKNNMANFTAIVPIVTELDLDYIVSRIIAYGHIEFLLFMRSINKIHYKQYYIRCAIVRGNLDIVKFFYQKNLNIVYDEILKMAIEFDRTSIVEFIQLHKN